LKGEKASVGASGYHRAASLHKDDGGVTGRLPQGSGPGAGGQALKMAARTGHAGVT